MNPWGEAQINGTMTLKVLTTGIEGILGVWDPSLGGFREASTDSQIPGNRELMNPGPKYMRLSEHRERGNGVFPLMGISRVRGGSMDDTTKATCPARVTASHSYPASGDGTWV